MSINKQYIIDIKDYHSDEEILNAIKATLELNRTPELSNIGPLDHALGAELVNGITIKIDNCAC